MNIMDQLDQFLEVFKIISADLETSYTELEKYEEPLVKKEPEFFNKENIIQTEDWVVNLLKDSDLQFRRRNYLRTFFSYLEGTLWQLSQILITNFSNNLNEKDILYLQEMRKKDNNGIKLEKRRIGLLKRILFVFNKLDKMVEAKSRIVENGKDWKNFKNVKTIRDKITHPKVPEDLNLSSGNIIRINQAHKWFSLLTSEFMKCYW